MIAGNYLQNDISSIFLISFLFAISDFLRNNILSGFPWNLWSYSFSWNLEVLQILPIIGFFSFNIIIISILFSPCFFLNRKKYGFIFFSFFVILLFTNYFYGSYKINSDSNKLSIDVEAIDYQEIENLVRLMANSGVDISIGSSRRSNNLLIGELDVENF